MPKMFRLIALMIKNRVIDLDIVNAHGVFLKMLAIALKHPALAITKYVKKRKIILHYIESTLNIDQKIVKKLFLCLTYGGSLGAWLKYCGVSIVK